MERRSFKAIRMGSLASVDIGLGSHVICAIPRGTPWLLWKEQRVPIDAAPTCETIGDLIEFAEERFGR